MAKELKNFIQNSTKSHVTVYQNFKIKILQKTFLLSILFIGAFPLHSDITKVSDKEPKEEIVAIHFGPGDDDSIALVESNEETNASNTTKKDWQ
jgi:hypothetical protein